MTSDRYASHEEMLVLLREVYSQPVEEQLVPYLVQRMADPVQPIDKNGSRRFHPLLLLLLIVTCAAAGVLVYLAYMRL